MKIKAWKIYIEQNYIKQNTWDKHSHYKIIKDAVHLGDKTCKLECIITQGQDAKQNAEIK